MLVKIELDSSRDLKRFCLSISHTLQHCKNNNNNNKTIPTIFQDVYLEIPMNSQSYTSGQEKLGSLMKFWLDLVTNNGSMIKPPKHLSVGLEGMYFQHGV